MTKVATGQIGLTIGFGAIALFLLLVFTGFGSPSHRDLTLVAYSTLAYCIVYTLVMILYNPWCSYDPTEG